MTDLSIAVDNIIIWDGIKTDFSDRFIENPTDCGNGVVDPGEECDDGKTDPSDGCTKWCTLCGNGEITPPETCDDGNLTNGDRCEADCTLPRCGNGILDTGEECDDANGNDADGCTNACTLCGNGEVTPPEECDDGNTVDGDCCTASCQEPLHVVTGPVVNATTGHAYYLLEAGSWPASEAQAVCLGGHLVTIDDAAEENWVWVQFARYGGTDRSLWIGLSDAASEGTFVWSGSAPLNYTHWYPGEPNDCCSGQDFVHIYPPSDGRSSWWGDTDAAGWEGGAVHGVVEVAPPPSATPTLTPTSTPTRTLTSTNTPTLTPTSTTRPSDGGDGGGGGCTMTPTGRSGAVWWALAPAMVLWWARRRALGTREVTPIP